MTLDAEFDLRRYTGTADELHAIAMPTDGERAELWIMQPTGPAVAMGSAQKPEAFDHGHLQADGVELASRRSGGGAVFIDPATTVWIDHLAPRSSRWYSTELVENFMIVGRVWQRALATLGVETEICAVAPQRTTASTLACWAGVGWGELTIGDAKIVGLSQRRTRWGSRVQAMAVLDGAALRVRRYLRPEDRPALTDMTGIDVAIAPSALIDAVVEAVRTIAD